MVGVAFSTLTISAHAACDFAAVSPPAVMGPYTSESLSDVNDPIDYKFVGIRDVLLNVTCTTNQTEFRISLTGITPVSGNLVFWGSNDSVKGALKFQANGARVGGVPVGIRLQSLESSAYFTQVDFTHDDAVILDLSNTSVDKRKNFSVNLHFTGLLSKNPAVTNRVELLSNFQAEAIGF